LKFVIFWSHVWVSDLDRSIYCAHTISELIKYVKVTVKAKIQVTYM